MKDVDVIELNLPKSIKIVLIYEYLFMFAIGPLLILILSNFYNGITDKKIFDSVNYLLLLAIYYFCLRLMLKKYLDPSKILKKKKLSIKYYYSVILLVLGLYFTLSSTLFRITIYIPDYTKYIFGNVNTNYNIPLKNQPLWNQIVSITSTCLVLPAAEEFIHRRVILGGLVKKYSIKKALIISSFIFAISHVDIQQVVNVLPLGLIDGIIYLRTYSITLSIFSHGFYNLIVTVLNDYITFNPNELTYVIVLAIGLVISFFYFKRFIMYTKPSERLSNGDI